MGYRQIDARGIWRGESKALEGFAKAFAFDCGGDVATFQKAYGWRTETIEQAIERAFGCMSPGMSGVEH